MSNYNYFINSIIRHDCLCQLGHFCGQFADHPEHLHLLQHRLEDVPPLEQTSPAALDHDGRPVSHYLGGSPGDHLGALLLVHVPHGDAFDVHGWRTRVPYTPFPLRGLRAELRKGNRRRGGPAEHAPLLLLLLLSADGGAHEGEALHLPIHGLADALLAGLHYAGDEHPLLPGHQFVPPGDVLLYTIHRLFDCDGGVVASNHGSDDHQAQGGLPAAEEDVLPPVGGDAVQAAVLAPLRPVGWNPHGRGVSHQPHSLQTE